MRRFVIVLLFLIALPAGAHHTSEHILGAPSPPPVATPSAAPEEPGSSRILWALGPFFVLVTIGVLRWGYRRHRDNKNKGVRD